jgi:tRNA modification GTPase
LFSTTDTIVAIATPPGRGGIGVIRVSGPAAHDIACLLVGHQRRFEPRHATLTLIRDSDAAAGAPPKGGGRSRGAIDQAVVTYFPAPASYTGEDVVEFSTHGSPVVLQHVVRAAMRAGARLAEPGEFTLRAFLHGRIDLPQAEAVADLIDAVTPLQARAAFDQIQGTLTDAIGEIDAALFDLAARLEASVDFPDEGYHFVDPAAIRTALDSLIARTSALLARGSRGRVVREGHLVAIVGKANVGKSSLFNALVGAPRAIVNEVPGTTRDLVSETIDFDGLRLTLVDTAGVRQTVDLVEAEGVSRSLGVARVADVMIEVVDGTSDTGPGPSSDGTREISQRADSEHVIVSNKSDKPGFHARAGTLPISAATGAGIQQLRERIADCLGWARGYRGERPEITNVRHLDLLERALEAMKSARLSVSDGGAALSEEFVLADLQVARNALEEISGKRATDELLAHIFERFCVGK